MSADSMALTHFRTNVKQVIAETDGLSISALVEQMNDRRRQRAEKAKQEKLHLVSRTFLSNMLNGKFDCAMSLAEEIAATLGVPLPVLISDGKNLRQPA